MNTRVNWVELTCIELLGMVLLVQIAVVVPLSPDVSCRCAELLLFLMFLQAP